MLILFSIWPTHVLTQVMFRLSCLLPCELLTLGNTKTNGFDEVLSSRSASGVPLLSKHCINIIYQNTSSNHLITFNGFWPGISLCSFMGKAGDAHKVFDQASCRGSFIDKTSCAYNVVDLASYCVRLLPRLAVLIMFWPGILLSAFLDQAGWTYIAFHQASCWYNFLTRPAKLIKLLIRHLVVFASLTRPAQATKGHLKGRNRSHRP